MSKFDIQDKTVKFSQLMLAVNEMDEKIDAIQEELSSRLEEATIFLKASIERMIAAIQQMDKIVSGTSSPIKEDDDEWLTTKEAGEFLKRSPFRVREDIKAGRYYGKTVNGQYRIKKSDLKKYMDDNQLS